MAFRLRFRYWHLLIFVIVASSCLFLLLREPANAILVLHNDHIVATLDPWRVPKDDHFDFLDQLSFKSGDTMRIRAKDGSYRKSPIHIRRSSARWVFTNEDDDEIGWTSDECQWFLALKVKEALREQREFLRTLEDLKKEGKSFGE